MKKLLPFYAIIMCQEVVDAVFQIILMYEVWPVSVKCHNYVQLFGGKQYSLALKYIHFCHKLKTIKFTFI